MTYKLIPNIEYILSVRKWKHAEMAEIIGGIKGPAISNWINLKSTPPLLKVISLAKAINVSVDTLIYKDLSQSPEFHPHLLKETGLPNEALTQWNIENNPHLLEENPELYRNHTQQYKNIKAALMDALGDRLAKIDEIYEAMIKADIIKKADAKQSELNLKKLRSKE